MRPERRRQHACCGSLREHKSRTGALRATACSRTRSRFYRRLECTNSACQGRPCSGQNGVAPRSDPCRSSPLANREESGSCRRQALHGWSISRCVGRWLRLRRLRRDQASADREPNESERSLMPSASPITPAACPRRAGGAACAPVCSRRPHRHGRGVPLRPGPATPARPAREPCRRSTPRGRQPARRSPRELKFSRTRRHAGCYSRLGRHVDVAPR